MEAAAFIQFETADRDKVTSAMDRILEYFVNQVGLELERVSYGGGQGAVFDLSELTGTDVYKPGYLVLDDQLVIATTKDSLELVASIGEGREEALAGEPGYLRLLDEVSGTRNPLVYVNIRAIREAVEPLMDADQRREYRQNAEAFVEPLRALILSTEDRDGLNGFAAVLTIK